MNNITIKTRLDDAISNSGKDRIHYQFKTGPRNLLKALKLLKEHEKYMEECYGNIGCGSSWIEIDGKKIGGFDIDDVINCIDSNLEDYIPTAIAKSLIDEIAKAKIKTDMIGISNIDVCEVISIINRRIFQAKLKA